MTRFDQIRFIKGCIAVAIISVFSGCASVRPEDIGSKKSNLTPSQFIANSFSATPDGPPGAFSFVAFFNGVESNQLYYPRRLFVGYCSAQGGSLAVDRPSTINPIGPGALLPPSGVNSSEERTSDYIKLVNAYSLAVSKGAIGVLKCIDPNQSLLWRVSIEPDAFNRGSAVNLLSTPKVRFNIKAL